MTMETEKESVMTKTDVVDLIGRFDLVSAKVLEHLKFDDEGRDLAIRHTSAYIITLRELVAVSDDVIDDDSIPVVMYAAEYLKLVDQFCAE